MVVVDVERLVRHNFQPQIERRCSDETMKFTIVISKEKNSDNKDEEEIVAPQAVLEHQHAFPRALSGKHNRQLIVLGRLFEKCRQCRQREPERHTLAHNFVMRKPRMSAGENNQKIF